MPLSQIETVPLQEMDPAYPLPASRTDLRDGCLLLTHVGEHLRLCPGGHMLDVRYHIPIHGMYGLTQLDPVTRQVVAFSGWTIDDLAMDLTQMPQELPPNDLTRDERVRLKSTDFRFPMISAMVNLARTLRLKQVKGMYSGDRLPPCSEVMDELTAYHRYDEPLRRLGFRAVEKINQGTSVVHWTMNL